MKRDSQSQLTMRLTLILFEAFMLVDEILLDKMSTSLA
jgi:hypothetical protein